MSTNITKYGLRVRLNILNGKSNKEIKEYFLSKGYHIHPGCEDDPESEPPVFLEGCNLQKYVNKTYPIRGIKGGWGVEHLFYVSQDGDEKGESVRPMETIIEGARELESEFECDIEDVKVFAYTYYTGSDEPVFL